MNKEVEELKVKLLERTLAERPEFYGRIKNYLTRGWYLPSTGEEEEYLDSFLTDEVHEVRKDLVRHFRRAISPEERLIVLDKSLRRLEAAQKLFACQKTVHFAEWHIEFFRTVSFTKRTFGRLIRHYKLNRLLDDIEHKHKTLSLGLRAWREEMIRETLAIQVKVPEKYDIPRLQLVKRAGERGWRIRTWNNDPNSSSIIAKDSEDYVILPLKIKGAEVIYYDEREQWALVKIVSASDELLYISAVKQGEGHFDDIFMEDISRELMNYILSELPIIRHGDWWFIRTHQSLYGNGKIPTPEPRLQFFNIEYKGTLIHFQNSLSLDSIPVSWGHEIVSGRGYFHVTPYVVELVVIDEVTVTHPEHGEIKLEKGIWRVFHAEGTPVRPRDPEDDDYLD